MVPYNQYCGCIVQQKLVHDFRGGSHFVENINKLENIGPNPTNYNIINILLRRIYTLILVIVYATAFG